MKKSKKKVNISKMIKGKFLISFVFFILGGIAMLSIYPRETLDLPKKVENNGWNSKLADIFDDEPKDIFPAPVSADSGWLVPPDPYVIRQVHIPEDENLDKLLRMTSSGTSTPVLSDKDINEIWSNSGAKIIDLDEFVKANNLPEIISLYFYRETRMPLKIWDEDISGDGVKDQLFTSVGVGCISCHTIFVDVFVKGAGIFSTETNNGTIYPRADKKGFYLDTAYTGNDYATCCADNFDISKYEWNGNGLTEVARKKIKYK